MNKTWLGSFYLTLASCIWGGMYVVVKVVVSFIPPLELVWLRYFVALIALVAVALITKQNWRIRKRDFPLIIAIGIIGHAISIVAQENRHHAVHGADGSYDYIIYSRIYGDIRRAHS